MILNGFFSGEPRMHCIFPIGGRDLLSMRSDG